MNKNTQIIDFQKMHKLKTPPSRYSELSVSISEKGMLTISSSLFNKMEKFDNKVIADFYLTPDMKTLAIKSSADANFKFPKSRRLQCNELLYMLDRSGFSIPVKYIVDWNDANNCFSGSLVTL